MTTANRTIHPALAIYPGKSPTTAMNLLLATQQDGDYAFDFSKVQITPQNFMPWTPERMRDFAALYPETQFRLHASLRIDQATVNKPAKYPWYDLGRYVKDPEGGRQYFEHLGALNKVLGSPDYTLHSGDLPRMPEKKRHSAMIQAMSEITDIMGCHVGIETLYPRKANARRYWLDSWADHAWLLYESELLYAVDLSHLNIIAHHEGPNPLLTGKLLENPRMIELHLSGNDGSADQHTALTTTRGAWWEELLGQVNPNAAWFSEGAIRNKNYPS